MELRRRPEGEATGADKEFLDPADAGFTFVNGLDEAIARAREAVGSKDVFVMGGADAIRQALRAGHAEELSISIAPSCSAAESVYSTTSTRR